MDCNINAWYITTPKRFQAYKNKNETDHIFLIQIAEVVYVRLHLRFIHMAFACSYEVILIRL